MPRRAKETITDPRHDPVRRAIQEMWKEENFGAVCPWNGHTAYRLGRLLEDNPNWDAEQFIRCVRNWFASENVNTSEIPARWIPQLQNYLARPLNKWGKQIPEKPAMQKLVDPEDKDYKAYHWLLQEKNEGVLAEFRKSGLTASEFMSRKRRMS